MQLRFLAIAGPPDAPDPNRRRLRAGEQALEKRLALPGLSVWTCAEVPTVAASGNDALAIGLLFEGGSGARVRRLPFPLPQMDTFTGQFWGAYVLLASDGNGHCILRDPSGAIPAYHWRTGRHDIYASDFEMLARVATEPFVPSMDFVRDWLIHPRLRGRRTGIDAVEEILPGECHRSHAGRIHRALAWRPHDHVSEGDRMEDFHAAAKHLREVLLFAIPRLAGCADDVVLQLSGGLDSSAIAGVLAAAQSPFRAMTFATRAPDGDERIYAREVARHCGIDLAELAEDLTPVPIARIPSLYLRPPPIAFLGPIHSAFVQHLNRTGAQLALDGSGGDNVFCFPSSASPALDAMHHLAPGAALASLSDLARLFDTTIWQVAKSACRIRRARSVWPRNDAFLPIGLAGDRAAHPWLDDLMDRLPRGKFEHVQSIVGIGHFLDDPAPGKPASLHPLLAQPVLETCLRIPTWVWIQGGRDRALVRAALKGLLPDAVLARRSKGRLESMFLSGYMAGRTELAELLGGGRLAQAGLIDVTEIRTYLQRTEQPQDAGYIRLLEMASAEVWLRSFET